MFLYKSQQPLFKYFYLAINPAFFQTLITYLLFLKSEKMSAKFFQDLNLFECRSYEGLQHSFVISCKLLPILLKNTAVESRSFLYLWFKHVFLPLTFWICQLFEFPSLQNYHGLGRSKGVNGDYTPFTHQEMIGR